MIERPPETELLTDRARFLENASPEIVQFFDYWQSLRRGSLLPVKTDFDPIAVPKLLRILWLHRFEQQNNRFVCQLAGEAINYVWNTSTIAGKDVADVIAPADYPGIHQRWLYMMERPAVFYGKQLTYETNPLGRAAERIVGPMTDEKGQPSFLIGISLYYSINKLSEREMRQSAYSRFFDCADC
ncbi:PAS domain-containing protein [Rhodovibrionaceae bacterium A322]